ncbi:MAG: endonuclease MutS2 [Cyanobacteria bacterium SIG30]|nr:endonuclease MutS2 [Cyanobacteria bacterium SIG30]
MFNLDKYQLSLELDKVLLRLSDFAITELGKTRCLEACVFSQKETIKYELSLVDEAKNILDSEGRISAFPLDFIAPVDEILNNLKLSAQDIVDLARTLKNSRIVRNFFQNYGGNLQKISQILYVDKNLEDEIFGVFDNSLNVVDGASSELKKLRNSKRDTEKNLKDKIASFMSDSSFCSHLQDSVVTTRNNRCVFQVKATDKNKVKGIVHDVSASGVTFFIEPESVVPINNKLQQLESEILAEIDRILANLSLKLHNIKKELLENKKILTEFDFIFAKAKYSIKTSSTSAVISDKKHIKFQGAMHPLLIGVVDNIVKNDIEIGENYSTLVVTGSNTGGKTVTLKTIGLLTIMTMAGLHIPCLYAEIYPFDKVLADISQEQNILQSLSTFSAHILNVKNILDEATSSSLVLFDELCSGTDPSEGSALAQAILSYLADKETITVITTHLGELKLLEYNDKRYKNASVEFDSETLKPTYKLAIGVAGSSNALFIADNLKIKPEITNHARKIIENKGEIQSNVFDEIQKVHLDMSKSHEKTKLQEKEIEDLKLDYEKKLAQIKAEKKKTIDGFKKRYQNMLDTAREEVKKTVDEIRKEKTEKIARRTYSRLSEVEKNLRFESTKGENEFVKDFEDIDWNKIKVGDAVLVKKFEQIATLLSMPNSKNMVDVSIGLMKTTVKIGELAKTNKKVKYNFKSDAEFKKPRETVSNRIDLRGMRAVDALDSLEIHLDLASLKGLSEITVIHGHGTGALKVAVREYLETSPYVASFRPGNKDEGADGVSIVYLK